MRITLRSLLLMLIFAVQTLSAQQQVMSVRTLDISSGMSSSMAFDVVKDDYGFIWTSTRLGIDCFDGQNFKHYSLSKNDMRMADDGVRHDLLYIDHTIYVYSDLGRIGRYRVDIDDFEEMCSVKPFLGGHSLHDLYVDDESLILGLYNGLCILDRKDLSVKAEPCKGTNVHCIIPFSEKTFLVGSNQGLWLFDLSHNTCERMACPDLDIKCLYYDPEQRQVWMGTLGEGLWTFRIDTQTASQVPNFEHSIITGICPYAGTQMLVGADGDGILQTSRLFTSPLILLSGTSSEALLEVPSSAVQGLYVDGPNIWVTTYDNGMVLLGPNSLTGVLQKPSANSLSETFCRDIDHDANGHIWVAYYHSICEYENENSAPKVYLDDVPGFLVVKAASDGTVWCGGYNTGLYHIDPQTGKTAHIMSLNGDNINSSIYGIHEDQYGDIWVGGLNMPLTRFRGEKEIAQFDITRVSDIGQLNDSMLVVVAVNGFMLINMETGKVNHLLQENDRFGWNGTNYISCLAIKDSHIIYLGTDGAGLLAYDTDTDALTNYNRQSHRLPDNNLRGMALIGDSVLWMSTVSDGIFSFDLTEEKVKNRLMVNDNLQSNEFYQHANTVLPNGNILFGGKAGAEVVYTQTMRDSHPKVEIFLGSVGIGQQEHISYLSHPEILEAPIFQTERIRLPYGERSLVLTFMTNDLYHQSNSLMLYKLDDSDLEWTTMGRNRTVSFYTLPTGTHHLTVRCLLDNGELIEKTFVIESLQTPWLSWPAILCYVLLLAILIVCGVLAYLNHMEKMASDEKIHFFSNVAHDIRTPLSLVAAPLSDLERFLSPDTPKGLVDLINRNLQHLSDVVNQLSLLSSTQLSTQQMNLVPIALCQFARNIVGLYEPLAKHHNLTIGLECPDEEIWIMADETSLRRICDNVLGNAFKFTKEGGVTIRVRARGHYGFIEVQDTGIGMSDATKRKLFRHFFRGENAIDEKVSGFGLGMMYSDKAVRKMHGRIFCQSQEGKGSTFTVSLPLTDAAHPVAKVSANMPSADSLPGIGDQMRGEDTSEMDLFYSGYRHDILIVEDNAELLDYLTRKLSVGYNVSRASSVNEAKICLKSHSADLIISDVMMPGMRGDEWCQELKSNFETSHIPMILLTAIADKDQKLHGLSVGADDYITKPFDITILLMKIRNIFEAKKRMYAYYMQTMNVTDSSHQKKESAEKNETPQNQRSLDDQFIAQLMALVEKNLANPDLSVDDIASEMAMSHTLFYEKVRKLLGVPPANLLRNCRMRKAKTLLLEGGKSINEISLMCGFADTKYFSTVFKKYYGCPPSKISEQ